MGNREDSSQAFFWCGSHSIDFKTIIRKKETIIHEEVSDSLHLKSTETVFGIIRIIVHIIITIVIEVSCIVFRISVSLD